MIRGKGDSWDLLCSYSFNSDDIQHELIIPQASVWHACYHFDASCLMKRKRDKNRVNFWNASEKPMRGAMSSNKILFWNVDAASVCKKCLKQFLSAAIMTKSQTQCRHIWKDYMKIICFYFDMKPMFIQYLQGQPFLKCCQKWWL